MRLDASFQEQVLNNHLLLTNRMPVRFTALRVWLMIVMVCHRLKRAGLDYWPLVCVGTHGSWEKFLSFWDALPAPKRLVAYSKFAATHYAVGGTYHPGDWILFGAETHGLPVGVRFDDLILHI